MRQRIVFQHPVFKNISDDQYWRLVIDGVQQTNSEELGWQAYNSREFGSVQCLLNTFSHMLTTVDKQPLSEKLLKDFHHRLFQITNISSEQLTAGDYHAPQGRGRTGTFNVFNESNFTPKGLEALQKKQNEGRLSVYEHGTYGFPTVVQMRYHSPSELSGEIQRIIELYYSNLKKLNEKEDDESNESARLLNIVMCVQDLEHLHPYADGNGRVFCTITLNKLLLENGFSPVILADPNRFDGFAPEEMVNEIIQGMNTFKKLELEMKPSVDDIILKQIEASYFSKPEKYKYVSTDGVSNTTLEKYKDPLHWAIATGLPNLFEKMLTIGMKAKIDINAKNNDGKTVLMLAAGYGDIEMIKKLLAIPGINLSVQDSLGYTAAMWAAETNHPEIISLLLAADKPAAQLQSKLGMTAKEILNLQKNDAPTVTVTEEKTDKPLATNLLFRFCQVLASLPAVYRGSYHYKETRNIVPYLTLSEHSLSRDDTALLSSISNLLATSRPDKLDISQLIFLYDIISKVNCIIPCKRALLTEIKEIISKKDFNNTLTRCAKELLTIDLKPFADSPVYKQLVDYKEKRAPIVNEHSHYSYSLKSLASRIASTHNSTGPQAVDFILSVPDFAICLFPTGTHELTRRHFLDNFINYPDYRDRLLKFMLANKQCVSAINQDMLIEIGSLFKNKPELLEKLIETVLRNKEARKNCLSGDISELISTFPNYKDKLVDLQESSNTTIKRAKRSREL